MTPAAMLLDRLTGRGVKFRLDGDALIPRGRRGALTPDVLDELRRHKAALVAELRRGSAPDNLAQGIDDLQDAYAERAAAVLEAGDITKAEARRISVSSFHVVLLGQIGRRGPARPKPTAACTSHSRPRLAATSGHGTQGGDGCREHKQCRANLKNNQPVSSTVDVDRVPDGRSDWSTRRRPKSGSLPALGDRKPSPKPLPWLASCSMKTAVLSGKLPPSRCGWRPSLSCLIAPMGSRRWQCRALTAVPSRSSKNRA